MNMREWLYFVIIPIIVGVSLPALVLWNEKDPVCLETARVKQIGGCTMQGNCSLFLEDGRVVAEHMSRLRGGPVCVKWGER